MLRGIIKALRWYAESNQGMFDGIERAKSRNDPVDAFCGYLLLFLAHAFCFVVLGIAIYLLTTGIGFLVVAGVVSLVCLIKLFGFLVRELTDFLFTWTDNAEKKMDKLDDLLGDNSEENKNTEK